MSPFSMIPTPAKSRALANNSPTGMTIIRLYHLISDMIIGINSTIYKFGRRTSEHMSTLNLYLGTIRYGIGSAVSYVIICEIYSFVTVTMPRGHGFHR